MERFYLTKLIGTFFVPLLILSIFLLFGIFVYSFVMWDWTLWSNPSFWKTLNPLLYTWSRILLLLWAILAAIIAGWFQQLQ